MYIYIQPDGLFLFLVQAFPVVPAATPFPSYLVFLLVCYFLDYLFNALRKRLKDLAYYYFSPFFFFYISIIGQFLLSYQ